MAHVAGLRSPAECLLRAFISSPRPRLPRTQLRTQARTIVDIRRIAKSPAQAAPAFDRLAEYTKDEAIESPMVKVKQADGKLGEPEQLRTLLRSLDRNTQVVVQLGRTEGRDCAVVQIYKKADLLQQVRDRESLAKQQQQSQKEKKPKTLELNWAIDEHDLQMKLNQMEQFLERGKKVEIMLAAKRRQRKATPEEGEEVLKRIRTKLSEIDAKEIKPMTGQVLRQAVLTIKKNAA